MKILLNGEAFATDAKTLDELCARLGFAEAKIATAVNGSFVAAAQRAGDATWPTPMRSRSWRRGRAADAHPLRQKLQLAAPARHGAISLAESLKQAVEASGAEIVTVSLRRESARARTGQGFWALIEELGCRVLPNTAGCRTAKEAIATAQDGARAVRHRLDQARSDRQ